MSVWADIADLAAVAARDAFTTTATTYTYKAGGSSADVAGVFDTPPLSAPIGNLEVEFSSSVPTFDVRLAELSQAPRAGDSLVIAGRTYEVTDVAIDEVRNAASLALVEIS